MKHSELAEIRPSDPCQKNIYWLNPPFGERQKYIKRHPVDDQRSERSPIDELQLAEIPINKHIHKTVRLHRHPRGLIYRHPRGRIYRHPRGLIYCHLRGLIYRHPRGLIYCHPRGLIYRHPSGLIRVLVLACFKTVVEGFVKFGLD